MHGHYEIVQHPPNSNFTAPHFNFAWIAMRGHYDSQQEKEWLCFCKMCANFSNPKLPRCAWLEYSLVDHHGRIQRSNFANYFKLPFWPPARLHSWPNYRLPRWPIGERPNLFIAYSCAKMLIPLSLIFRCISISSSYPSESVSSS